MAVDSVTSSASAAQAALQKSAESAQSRQIERDENRQPPTPRDEDQRPVVNADGQTTGTVINVTA